MTITTILLGLASAFALWVGYHIARFHRVDSRKQRQLRCREWIEHKLRGPSAIGHYEAQCAFRMLISDPEWPARGPWEWEEFEAPRAMSSRTGWH